MTTAPPAAGHPVPPAPWRQRLWSPLVRTWLVYLPICFVTSTLAASAWDARTHGVVGAGSSGASVLLWITGLVVASSLVWRRRFPVAVTVITAVAPILLPLEPTAALIAFGSLVVRRFDRVVAALAGLVFIGTSVSIHRDGQGLTKGESFWQLVTKSGPDLRAAQEPLSVWVLVGIAVGAMAAAFGVAMIVRDRTLNRARRQREQAQETVVATLSDELARQAERERLAQEVHDALGHRLSLLSLHAGALELASEDPRAAESAALVRANAQQSMDDLRSLLAMLRQPDAPDVVAAVPTIDDVETLVDDTVSTGVPLVSTVMIRQPDRLDETTSRSAYRIVQELLTNARRHAPGIGVRVRVVSSPADGVVIEVANHLRPDAPSGLRPGSGLTGISTRVEQLQGQWHVWVDDHRVFRAAAHLPWVWRGDPTAGSAVGSDEAQPVSPEGPR